MNSTQSRSISLSWTPPVTPNGTITQYELQYGRSDSTSALTSLNITDTSHTIMGLMPTVSYMVQLRAYTRVGAGPFINQTSVTESDRKWLCCPLTIM